MIKSIKLKLWLTLFVTLVVCWGALLGLSYFGIKQRFLDYATSHILERLAPLEEAVLDVYRQQQSLSEFTDNPNRWNQLRDATYRQYLRDQQRANRTPLSPRERDWGDRESLDEDLQPNLRAFFQFLILVDPKRNLIAGRPREQARYIFRELRHDDVTIALIGYVKPKAILRSVDRLFLNQQIQSFGLFSLFMVFAALLATLMVSRWLVKPLTVLARCAKQVAAGDFSMRVDHRADDELGTLCRNFDEMTESLEQNEITRRQWVADISHEMRTPLSVLKAQLEAMEDGIRPTTPENLHVLSRNIDSLSSVVDDLYQLSLADVGELRLQRSQVCLVQVIESALQEFEAKFDQKQFELKAELPAPGKAYEARVDSARIHQVLVNLLENSYRYTDEQGTVRVSLTVESDALAIIIEDSAPGVPEEAMRHIFDRLYRLESSRNRETGGAGLGLSICAGIVRAHGGSLEATASTLGGLRQTLVIPRTQTHD